LVREQLADRPSAETAASGDMRAFDTMQKQFSLADRFGLTVIYTTPGQENYLRIAEHIAERRGLLSPASPEEERGCFRENALKWEKWFNGRSPRTAVHQYVDWAAGAGGGERGGIKFPWDQGNPKNRRFPGMSIGNRAKGGFPSETCIPKRIRKG
jgi:predicted AAA+ superfamily ATPase